MKTIIAGVRVEGTPEEISKLLNLSAKLEKMCLSYGCKNQIEKGNYCEEHRWADNEMLPKPNDGEKIMKAG